MALEDNFRGMAFGTADWKFVEPFVRYWIRVVFRFVVPHGRTRPRQTDLHDLHGDAIGEIRRHLGYSRGFLWSHKKWNSQAIKNRLDLERVAHAPYDTELNQFAVFGIIGIGVGKIVSSRIAELRRFVLEENGRRHKRRRGCRLLGLVFSLQSAMRKFLRECLFRKV